MPKRYHNRILATTAIVEAGSVDRQGVPGARGPGLDFGFGKDGVRAGDIMVCWTCGGGRAVFSQLEQKRTDIF
jgi:hypothetical protein